MARRAKHQRFEPKARAHPSGKPQPSGQWDTETKARVPYSGRLSPGLQQQGLAHAIGFTAQWSKDEYWEV